MKKIDRFIGIDGIERTYTQIEKEFYAEIIKSRPGGFVSPFEKVIELKEKYKGGKKGSIIKSIKDNFESIIIGKPKQLQKYIDDFKNLGLSKYIYDDINEKLTELGEDIEDALRYNYFRKKIFVEHAERINVKTCPYCNSQFTLVVPNNSEKIAKFQFDHYFPKSQFPYLSISMYNLIPSCANCNLGKKDNFYKLDSLVNPFDNNFHNLTSFKIGNKESFRMLTGVEVPENEITINLSNQKNVNVANYEKEFHLTGIYNRHKDIVKEIYRKAYAYNHGGKKALLQLKNQNGNKIFNDIHEIEQLLLANYRLRDDINKRPLAKFMQDIAKEAGLIK